MAKHTEPAPVFAHFGYSFQGDNMDFIEWSDFAKVELRVGKVIDAAVFPEASKPA